MGIKPHGRGIQLTFTYAGKTCRPTLKLRPTAANQAYAEKLLAQIKIEISAGSFNFEHHFPGSRAAPAVVVRETMTFGVRADAWVRSLTDAEHSTKVGYERALKSYWATLRDKDISLIKNSDIREILGALTVGKKTRNNAMIPARGVFEQAVTDEVIKANPMALIKNAKVQKEPPDPFELEEIPLILAQLEKMYGPQAANYFAFAFYAGVRPSEQIVLAWSDVDWRAQTVKVRRAKVWGEYKATTKTHLVRDVELNVPALAALEAQRAHTFLARGVIFHNPNTGRPWANVEHQRRLWERTFAHTGLRYREPYQTRHTFASQALMAGANPMWVSRQLGHKNMKMLLEVYGKWIDMADRSRESDKVGAAFSTNVAQRKTAS